MNGTPHTRLQGRRDLGSDIRARVDADEVPEEDHESDLAQLASAQLSYPAFTQYNSAACRAVATRSMWGRAVCIFSLRGHRRVSVWAGTRDLRQCEGARVGWYSGIPTHCVWIRQPARESS
jgi:hypothetical protein